jgi:hypothetical protein
MVLCALAVAACTESDHTVQDLAACQLEATKVYPHWLADNRKTADEPHRQLEGGPGAASDMGYFAYLCMKAKGYEYDANHNRCGISDVPLFEQWTNQTREQCYRKATR